MARRLTVALCAALLLCTAVLPSLSTSAAAPRGLRSVTIGMGYIPSVQFAPYYVAAAHGYYRQAGLNITFSYAYSPNLLQLVGSGRVDFANADGTDVLAAAAQGYPITYVMAEYQRFPVAIFALKRRHIRTVADLRGKTIGVPGRFGATYVGLLAALHAAGLRPGEVHISVIGYTQVQSVAAGTVDAAVGYSVNEPVILQRRGYSVTTIEVAPLANLVPPGVIAGRTLIARDPAVVHAFVQATLHGLADTITDPAGAFAIARQVKGISLTGRDIGDQQAVLNRAIVFWHSTATKAHGLGYIDPVQWIRSVVTLRAIGQPGGAPSGAILYTNRFAAGSARL